MRMNLTHLLQVLLLPAIAILFPGIAYSMDLKFRPRLEAGIEYYKIKQDNLFRKEGGNSSIGASSLDAADWMPILSGGMTIIANRFYADISGLKAFDGDDNFSRDISYVNFNLEPLSPTFSGTGNARGDSDFDRWEYAVSLGYLLTDNLSLFAGYRKSEVDMKFKTDVVLNVPPPIGDISGGARVKGTFEQDGPFIGATYGWQVNTTVLKGILSSSLAFAALDGNLDIDSVNVEPPLSDSGIPDDSSDGDTIGMKVGFTWIGSTPVDRLSYTLAVDGYKYDFDASGDDPDVTETVINLKIGLAYMF